MACFISVNKVLLEHSHTHTFITYLWLLCITTAELTSCDRDYMALPQSTYYLVLHRGVLPTPALESEQVEESAKKLSPRALQRLKFKIIEGSSRGDCRKEKPSKQNN